MAVQTAQEQIQPLTLTKRMLGTAETEKLGCAFALTKDKKECVLLIAKTGSGKKAAATLKTTGKEFVDPQTLRFGQVDIDVPNDPGTVRFTVNRSEAGGTVMHMLKLVKRAGYQSLVINADSTLEDEAEGPDAVASDETASAAAPPDPPPLNRAPPAPPTLKAPDPAALQRALDALTPKLGAIAGGDAAELAKLEQTAADATAALAAGDLPTAAASLQVLREAAMAAAQRATNKPAGAQVAVTQAMLLWGKTRGHLETQLKALQQAIIEQAAEEADFTEIKAAAPALSEVLAVLDTRLEAKLQQVQDVQDAAQRDKLRQEAKAIVGEYQSYIAAEPLMGALDSNPFIPFDGASRVSATLSAIMKTL